MGQQWFKDGLIRGRQRTPNPEEVTPEPEAILTFARMAEGKKPQEGRRSHKRIANPNGVNTLE